jgi:hypothetical protein
VLRKCQEQRNHADLLAARLIGSESVPDALFIVLRGIHVPEYVRVHEAQELRKPLPVLLPTGEAQRVERFRGPARLINQLKELERLKRSRGQALRHPGAHQHLKINRCLQATVPELVND